MLFLLLRYVLFFVVARQEWLVNGPLTKLFKDLTDFEPNFDFLDRNTHILYPALALVAVGLLVIGILSAWRSDDISGLAKVEYKREIIIRMRKNVGGVSIEDLSRDLKVKPLQMAKIVEEMQTDGMVVPHTNAKHVTLWRLRGVGGA